MNASFPMDDPNYASSGQGIPSVNGVLLRGSRDLVAAVPYMLGFHPGPGTLIAVAMCEGRISLTTYVEAARLDLHDIPGLWIELARPLTQACAQHLVLIGYLAEADEDRLQVFVATSPLPVFEVLRVEDGRWWSLSCPNGPTCCPPGQRVVADPAVVAPLVAAADAPAASRAGLGACLRPGPAEQVSAVARLLPLTPAPPPVALYQAVADAHAECVDGPVRLTADRAAVLLQAVTIVNVRDAACVWHDDAAWWLWTTLIRYAPPTHVPPVAALIATTAYQRGITVLAQMAAEHALAIDPGYGLGHLVLDIVEAQIHPATVRRGFARAMAEIPDLPADWVFGPAPASGPRHDTASDVPGGDGDG
ncbi:MAG: hypothetical protein QG597_3883 [Actinomycetota bacterium]|nr:hypothetical protein [Actinomycetota bacterium]